MPGLQGGLAICLTYSVKRTLRLNLLRPQVPFVQREGKIMSHMKEMHSTVICLRDGKLLFVRKEAPEWSLPGGKIEPGEQPLEAARRELREETTLPLGGEQFLGHFAFESEEHYLYRMPVTVSMRPTPSDEIIECRWFTLEELQHVVVKPTNLELLKRVRQLFHP